MTISLKANKELSTDSSIITIKGICGTLTNEDVTIESGSDGDDGNVDENDDDDTGIGPAKNFLETAEWDRDTKMLKITTGGLGMVKDTPYVVKFKWLLLEEENAACPITFLASGTHTFISRPMDNDSGNAGKVLSPSLPPNTPPRPLPLSLTPPHLTPHSSAD